MNLHEVLPLVKPKSWNKKQCAEDAQVAKVLRMKEITAGFEDFRQFIKTHEERDAHALLQRRLRTDYDQDRLALLLQHHWLPKALLDGDRDVISMAATSPKVSLKNLRKMADALGYALLPLEYLDERSFDEAGSNASRAAKGFATKLEKYYQVYVMSSARYYSIHNHVHAQQDKLIYAAKTSQQAFMALNMAIPMFRSLFNNIAELENNGQAYNSRLDQHDAKLKQHERELNNLKRRVDELCDQVEGQQTEELLASAKDEATREELTLLEESGNFWLHQAFIFAISKKTKVTGEDLAIIGPCWGPEPEDSVLEAIGFGKVKGQRKRVGDQTSLWSDWCSGYGGSEESVSNDHHSGNRRFRLSSPAYNQHYAPRTLDL